MFQVLISKVAAAARVLSRLRAELAEAQQHLVPALVAALGVAAEGIRWI